MKKRLLLGLAMALFMATPTLLTSQILRLEATPNDELFKFSSYELEEVIDFSSFFKEEFTYMMLPMKEDAWLEDQEVSSDQLRINAPEYLWQVVSKKGRYFLQPHMHSFDNMPFLFHPENLRSLGSPNVGIELQYDMR